MGELRLNKPTICGRHDEIYNSARQILTHLKDYDKGRSGIEDTLYWIDICANIILDETRIATQMGQKMERGLYTKNQTIKELEEYKSMYEGLCK